MYIILASVYRLARNAPVTSLSWICDRQYLVIGCQSYVRIHKYMTFVFLPGQIHLWWIHMLMNISRREYIQIHSTLHILVHIAATLSNYGMFDEWIAVYLKSNVHLPLFLQWLNLPLLMVHYMRPLSMTNIINIFYPT